MKQEVAKLLSAALRSGRFKQGKRALKIIVEGEAHFCCLGVLCELYREQEVFPPGRWSDFANSCGDCGFCVVDKADDQFLPLAVQAWAGMVSKDGLPRVTGEKQTQGPSLAKLNDRNGMTFPEIARYVDKYWELL